MNVPQFLPTSPTDLAALVTNASRRAVAAAFASVLFLLAFLLAERSLFLHLETRAHERVAAVASMAHRVEMLDHQLTMAAHLVALRNDEHWRRLHAQWLAQSHAVMTEALAMASPGQAQRFKDSTQASSDALIATEAQVFELAARGDLVAASALLVRAEYLQHKAQVAAGSRRFLSDVLVDVQARSDRVTQRGWALLGLSFLAVLLLLGLLWRHLNRNLAQAGAGFERQHQAQLALQAADRGKAQILDGARAGTWQWDLPADRLSLNAQAASVVGAKLGDPELAHASGWRVYLHPGDVERVDAAFRQHLGGAAPYFDVDMRIRHREGHWVWLQVCGQVAERDGQGRALLMAGSLTDISARVHAEQLWQARAELSSDWYWQTDTAHRLSQVHTGPDTRLAALARGMLGRRRDEIAMFDAPAGGWAALHARMDAHEPFSGVAYQSRAWGSALRWIELDGRPRFDAADRFLGYEGVGRDVTERRRVADELRASLALVDTLFQAIPVPVVMKDMQGVTLRANRAYAEHYGLAPEQVIGLRSADLLDVGAAVGADADRAEMSRTLQPLRKVSRAHLRDGRVRDAVIHKAPLLDARGQMTGMVAVVIDVSEERAVAHALEQARDAAEAANRAKSAFLATMSHEIRTPMNGVLGMSELLLHSNLDARQAESVRTISESAVALLRIIDDILDFSKIEAGHLALEPAALDLRALLQAVTSTLAPAAARQGLEVRVDVDAAVPAWVWGDGTRLRQVLTNLLGNAVKFGRRDRADAPGALGAVHVSLRPQGERMCLCVADRGIGMGGDTLKNLFQPFMQAEPSTVRRYGGTGLGLAITHRLVALMGGYITVDSVLGQGTAFTVLLNLPAVPADTAAPPAAAAEPAASIPVAVGASTLILVAEDDAVNRMVVTRQLELLGYQVEVADNGAAALALWRSGRFALLLTDLHMPGMDGYELARTIRHEEAAAGAARAPLLALTANAMAGEARRALDLGMDAYLTKPIRMHDLQAALQRGLAAAPARLPTAQPAVAGPLPQAARAAATAAEAEAGIAAPAAAAAPGPGSARNAALAVFDRQTLRGLLGDDSAVLRRLLSGFHDTTPGQLQALVDALRRGDWPTAHAQAHSLKSAARTVGALALAEACADAEEVCSGPGPQCAHAGAMARELADAWPALQQALQAELHGLGPAAAATA